MNKLLRLATGKSEPPPRSPEREVLAAAIEKHSAAVRELDVTKQALRTAKDRIYQDGNQAEVVERAKAAVEDAKTNAAAHMTKTLLGNAGAAPVSVKEARRALQAAEDDLEALQAVEATLAKRVADCERDLAIAKRKLDEAIRDVVFSGPGIRKLLIEFDNLKRDLEIRGRALSWFSRRFLIPDEFKNWQSTKMYDPAHREVPEGTEPWKDALEQLAIDADTPLPTS
jgi:predicted  nucleic acid-binding Zn-ribbon protein